jgi:hypothetical protein
MEFTSLPSADNASDEAIPPDDTLATRIHFVRGQRVILDSALAALYEVPTKALNQAVRRNQDRFPEDFAFQLSAEELTPLAAHRRSQSVTGSRRNVRHRPWAFTEHGVTMLASLLRSDRAIRMSIAIVRAFVRMRELLASHAEIAHRIDALEQRSTYQEGQLVLLFDVVHQILAPDAPASEPKRISGFMANT